MEIQYRPRKLHGLAKPKGKLIQNFSIDLTHLHAQSNMSGRLGCRTMETNGGSSVPYLACTPCVPLFSTLFNRDGNRRAFRLLGEGGDHVRCTVEPSPGHIRCRTSSIRTRLRTPFLRRPFPRLRELVMSKS